MNSLKNDEIDLVEIIGKVYRSRKTIIYISLIFVFIGLVIALLLPIKYSSTTVFIPQNQESKNSSLSGVASLVGINFSNNNYGGEIPSSMYPQIAESTKFKRMLLSEIIDLKNNLSLKKIIIDEYKLNQDDNKKSSSLYVSKLEEKCFDVLDEIITIDVNQKDGFVSISAIMSNAEFAAIVSNKTKDILQKIIIENKIESARQNLTFSETQLFEKKLLYDEIQAKLALFSDSNLNSVNSFIINEKGKLEAEFEIINAVVTELSKQVEQAKLQVTKETPVFSTIKEAVIPNKKASPKRKQIVIIFGLIGFIFSIAYTLIKDPIKKIFSIITIQ